MGKSSTEKLSERCNSCEVLYINGIKCHETGCPDSWKDSIRKCAWCGTEFKPGYRAQTCCTDDCKDAYLS
jgi:predicted methyltransferase